MCPSLVTQEANAWFHRNKAFLEGRASGPDVHFICERLKSEKIARVLEIGCSSGQVLQKIVERFDASGVGIDPSPAAVRAGNSRFREFGLDITLEVGDANDLPYPDGSFDLVIMGFFLYIEDRRGLLRSFAEADRVLRSGGFLAITDFDTGITNIQKDYVHQKSLKVYKADYGRWLSMTGHYYLADKLSFSSEAGVFHHDLDERCSTQLFFKEDSAHLELGGFTKAGFSES